MKHIFTSLILLCLLNFGNAQYVLLDTRHNEINQTVVRTSDNGYLVSSVTFCYTPDEFVIEGCPIGIHLIKTNESGDTLWEEEIINYDVQGLLHVFENSDSTFTIFTAQDATFHCHEYVIEPPFGLLQILTYHVSAMGEVISQTSFPDNCNLQLLTAQQVTDTSYAVVAIYNEIFASDTVEGRLYLLDQKGAVLQTQVFPGDYLNKADIMIDSQQNILLFYVDRDSIAQLHTYDHELNLLQTRSNANINSYCLDAESLRALAELTDDENIVVMCDDAYGKEMNLELFVFDMNLQLLAQDAYTLPRASDFTVNEFQEIMILSQIGFGGDSTDMKLTYFNLSVDSLRTRVFNIPGNQAPNDLLALEGDNFAIAGGHNCCNLSANVGPGKTFLYLSELSSATPFVSLKSAPVIVFPNPARDFITINPVNGITSVDAFDVSIYTATGEKVYEQKIEDDDHIPVDFLTAGFYFLSLHFIDGTSAQRTFVKL